MKIGQQKGNYEEKRSCWTPKVGIALRTLRKKSGAAYCGATVVDYYGNQNRWLARKAPVVKKRPYRPLSVANLKVLVFNMINEALRLVRVFHNVKQKDLADALGVSPSHLSEIESGKKQVTMEILEKYSTHFKIPASSLLYFAEHKNAHGEKAIANPIAMKALKMLDWIETITRDEGGEDEKKVPA